MGDPMTTPTDYPDRVRALLEAATPGEWQWSDDRGERGTDEGGIRASTGELVLWLGDSEPYENSHGMCNPEDRALIAEAPTLARAYLDLHAEVERLTRVLAVEGGDESAAPEGWRPAMGGAWSGKDDNYVHRIGAGRWSWVSRDTRNKVRGRGEAPTALEAMETADRAAGGAA